MRLHRFSCGRGVTLLEIILALAVLTVAALSLVLMFTRGMELLGSNKRVARATETGQGFLETVRARGPANITLGTYDGRILDSPDPTTGFPPPPYPETVDGLALKVEATDTGLPPGLVSVTVDVFFDGDRKVTLEAYYNL